MTPPPTGKDQAGGGVSEERFTEAIENIRREVTAGLTTAGVQIGAVEKTLSEKIGSLKVWGVLALVTGQTAAAIVSAYIGPTKTAQTVHSAALAVSRLFQ